MTVADLQARIFDIEIIATTLWDLKLAGGPHRGSGDGQGPGDRAPSSRGSIAPDAGTWMLALTCSKCQTPAPVRADHPRAERGRH